MLTGRRQIFTDSVSIDSNNVVSVVGNAFTEHLVNRGEIDYLYNYYKGNQPIFFREKFRRQDITNIVCENHANEIVAFKTGFICGEPIQYVSRKSEYSDEISDLNEMMMSVSKASKDRELVEWAMICGTAYRIVLPTESFFEMYTLDPRNAFVIYRNDFRKQPLCGVTYTQDKNGNRTFSVYTDKEYFEIKGSKITNSYKHSLGMVPIVEYPANDARLGCFETVLTLLDAINNIDSNRVDGLEQFIQSLIVCYNCEFEEGTSSDDIARKGILYLKSTVDNKADVKILAEQLNQTQTQTLKNDLYKAVLTICGVPAQSDGSGSESSNNGAVILRNGWQSAEARAKDYELVFKRSEQEMLKLVLRILDGYSLLDLDISAIDYRFTRRNYEDVLTKSQVLVSMLGSDKIAPKLAFNACGLFSDPETAYLESEEYINDTDREVPDAAVGD